MTAKRSDDSKLPELNELQALIAVVEAGSVSAGARELKQPRATISRRIARLEERFGVRLLHRTTRRLVLTTAGEELFRHARTILASVDLATHALQSKDLVPRGLLRVSVPPIQDGSFRAMLLEFVKTWPEVDLEVISTTLHQDLLNGHIDVAIRAGSTIDQGLIARRFAESMMYALASPDYLERAGSPKNAGELIDHQCIVGFTRGERPQTHWPLLAGGQVRVASHISSNDLTLLMAAAIEGQGIAFLPDAFVAEALAAGTLVRVLPESVGALTQVALVFPERYLMRPVVRAFVDHTVQWVKKRGLFSATGLFEGPEKGAGF